MLSMKPDRTFMTYSLFQPWRRAPGRTVAFFSVPAKRRGSEPASADLVAIERKPLQGNHGHCIVDLVALQHGVRLGKRQNLDQDVLAFGFQAENAAGIGRVGATEEETACLRAGAGRKHDVMH